ncbi:ArdC-like ssDNA-binding domain-containing protein [Yoonia sp. 2307UL14-13]|uniref:ArdC-like ssDNA-binding domain-containing protein n=1 Tax=Yoonia sp. 2307UL14-13 TaxID=3126506 RepID=UPI00309E3660
MRNRLPKKGKKPVREDIYQKVTNKIIEDLEQGKLSWLKPWSIGNLEGKITKPLRHNGVPYNGINILMLWGASVEAGYVSPFWMTYRQAKDLGAHIKKGERGNLVVYANTITKTEEQEDGSEQEQKIPFMKGYSVFNACQIEGLPEHYYIKPEPIIDPASRIDHADELFAYRAVCLCLSTLL